MSNSPLLDVCAAASLLGVKPATLWKLRDAGTLPCIRVSPRKIFFRREDVEAILVPKIETRAQ